MEQLTDKEVHQLLEDCTLDVAVELGEHWEEIAKLFYRLGRESAPTTVINNFYSNEPTVYGPVPHQPTQFDFNIPPGTIIGGFAT